MATAFKVKPRHKAVKSYYAALAAYADQRVEREGPQALWTKARDLYARIGITHMVEKVQGWLDDLPDAGV